MVLEQVTFLEFTRKVCYLWGRREGGCRPLGKEEDPANTGFGIYSRWAERHSGWLVKNGLWRGKCRYARPVRRRVWSESKRMKMTWVRKQILLCLLFILWNDCWLCLSSMPGPGSQSYGQETRQSYIYFYFYSDLVALCKMGQVSLK